MLHPFTFILASSALNFIQCAPVIEPRQFPTDFPTFPAFPSDFPTFPAFPSDFPSHSFPSFTGFDTSFPTLTFPPFSTFTGFPSFTGFPAAHSTSNRNTAYVTPMSVDTPKNSQTDNTATQTTSTASSSSRASSAPTSPSGVNTVNDDFSSPSHMSTGAMIGAIFGSFAGFCVLILLWHVYYRRRQTARYLHNRLVAEAQKEKMNTSNSEPKKPVPPPKEQQAEFDYGPGYQPYQPYKPPKQRSEPSYSGQGYEQQQPGHPGQEHEQQQPGYPGQGYEQQQPQYPEQAYTNLHLQGYDGQAPYPREGYAQYHSQHTSPQTASPLYPPYEAYPMMPMPDTRRQSTTLVNDPSVHTHSTDPYPPAPLYDNFAPKPNESFSSPLLTNPTISNLNSPTGSSTDKPNAHVITSKPHLRD